MSEYTITLYGCDDRTEFNIELDEREFTALDRISDMSFEHSEYGCMPVLTIEAVTT